MAETPKNKGGRPERILSDKEWQALIGMMTINCTQEEICSILQLNSDTLDKEIKKHGELGFSDMYKKHANTGKQSLRRMQLKSAQDGNVTMQIWLGKQWLGQTDKVTTDHQSSDGSMTPTRQLSTEELMRIASGGK